MGIEYVETPLAEALREIERLKREVTFLAQYRLLSVKGHATVREHGRLRELAERYEREP